MINFPLHRLPSVRYLMSTTTFGLTVILIFLLILINLINSLQVTHQVNFGLRSSPKILLQSTLEVQSKLYPVVGVTNFSIGINSGITHTSVTNLTSKDTSQNVININNNNNDHTKSQFLPDNHNLTTNNAHRSMRVKRGLIQLASMIKCVSGCEPFQYKGYGCFCGLFGSGKPVDPIDRCCLKHDHCYAMAPCHQLLLYLMPYSWDCVAPGYANCALTDFSRSKDKCGFSLCECDRVFAECISKYPCPSSKAKCQYKPMVLTVYGK